MVFMADVFVPCELCGGSRFKPEVLEVTYRDLSVARVLELTVDEAIRFFIREDRLGKILWQLQQVGLGYLRLGQPATTLSGGEAQRLKIARELSGAAGRKGAEALPPGRADHRAIREDVRRLLRVLARLLEAGHTVLLIEHNLGRDQDRRLGDRHGAGCGEPRGRGGRHGPPRGHRARSRERDRAVPARRAR